MRAARIFVLDFKGDIKAVRSLREEVQPLYPAAGPMMKSIETGKSGGSVTGYAPLRRS